MDSQRADRQGRITPINRVPTNGSCIVFRAKHGGKDYALQVIVSHRHQTRLQPHSLHSPVAGHVSCV